LQDRLSALKAFNEEKQKVEAELVKLEEALQNTKSAEELQELFQQNESLLPRLSSLQALAESTKPMAEPSARVDSLEHRQAALDNRIQKARDAAAEDEKHMVIVQMYTEQVDALEDQLKNAEQELALLAPTVDQLDAYTTQRLMPLLAQYHALDLTEPPNDELKRRKQQLKSQTSKLQSKVDEKTKSAAAQEDLVNRLDKEIAKDEAVLADILSRYEEPQDLETAVNDAKALATIRQSVVSLPLDEVSDKTVREQLSRRVEPLHVETNVSVSEIKQTKTYSTHIHKISLQDFLQLLTQEIERSQKLAADLGSLNQTINQAETEVAAPSGGPEDVLARSAELSQSIPLLKANLTRVGDQLNATSNLIRQPELPLSQLEQAIDQLEKRNDVRRRRALDEQKVAKLAPQIEALSLTLQSTMNDLENAPPVSLDQQELTLRKLEEEKQKIHTLLESIPEEAEELREKSRWELSRLSDFIRRLGEAVGDKISALTSFLATKNEVETQLADINRQLDVHNKEIEQLPSSDQLVALNEQEQKVKKLQQKLSSEVAVESLDPEKSNELQELRKALELMCERISEARAKAEYQLAQKNAADLLKVKVNTTNNDLVSLIDQSNRLLNDAAAIPQSYLQLSDRIEKAVDEAQQLLNEDPTAETLQANIAEAQLAKQKLSDRWQVCVQKRIIRASDIFKTQFVDLAHLR
jgi:chromosome segregation ATPase